jgi:hypothetical protein
MSIKVAYRDGVFEPLENVESLRPGKKSFDFWNNPSDAVYDTL